MDEIEQYLKQRGPSPFATFRCTDCEQTFPDRLPAWHEDWAECRLYLAVKH